MDSQDEGQIDSMKQQLIQKQDIERFDTYLESTQNYQTTEANTRVLSKSGNFSIKEKQGRKKSQTKIITKKPKQFIEIVNNEQRRTLPNGSRLQRIKFDFNFMMFIGTAYMMAYFFLTGFALLILSTSSLDVTNCSIPIISWFKVSVTMYVFSFTICLFTVLKIKKHGLQTEIINFGAFELVLEVYNRNWAYIVVLSIDMFHLALTIWGTIQIERVKPPCFFEIPALSNFMLIMVILGYIYLARVIVTVTHYKFGVRIYRYLRRNLRVFRKYDRTLRAKFPVYLYRNYQQMIKEQEAEEEILPPKQLSEANSINEDKEDIDSESEKSLIKINSDDDVCPICCDQFQDESEVVLMPCNIKHIYHPKCIEEWLTKHINCPLCKAAVFKNTQIEQLEENIRIPQDELQQQLNSNNDV
ncbi:e3 ubiquitin-protein ligase sis3-like [Stylonychia lemnae]|uniref:RING-type E3 ubiquitin transferase n=1 Tax=Stylonychia lemnae TaxID=5949 RepID=A0A078AQ73_STYLE|nr:e3 ubiquitin-protein ligase sis3-like [Stylonychia lemnae]|eukprot:CDW84121.1 e3 ubiquitin-protein ligase sis3-like [Stylonychia lemnae]